MGQERIVPDDQVKRLRAALSRHRDRAIEAAVVLWHQLDARDLENLGKSARFGAGDLGAVGFDPLETVARVGPLLATQQSAGGLGQHAQGAAGIGETRADPEADRALRRLVGLDLRVCPRHVRKLRRAVQERTWLDGTGPY